MKNPIFHVHTNHIEVHYHFVYDRVLSDELEQAFVPTGWQIADIFTKPLGLDKLWRFSSELGLRHLDTLSRKSSCVREMKRNRRGPGPEGFELVVA